MFAVNVVLPCVRFKDKCSPCSWHNAVFEMNPSCHLLQPCRMTEANQITVLPGSASSISTSCLLLKSAMKMEFASGRSRVTHLYISGQSPETQQDASDECLACIWVQPRRPDRRNTLVLDSDDQLPARMLQNGQEQGEKQDHS